MDTDSEILEVELGLLPTVESISWLYLQVRLQRGYPGPFQLTLAHENPTDMPGEVHFQLNLNPHFVLDLEHFFEFVCFLFGDLFMFP